MRAVLIALMLMVGACESVSFLREDRPFVTHTAPTMLTMPFKTAMMARPIDETMELKQLATAPIFTRCGGGWGGIGRGGWMGDQSQNRMSSEEGVDRQCVSFKKRTDECSSPMTFDVTAEVTSLALSRAQSRLCK